MTLIKILLVLVAIGFILTVLRGASTRSIKALKKLGLVALGLVMILVVLFPDLTNAAARLVGVGRGTDLLLYILVVAVIMFILNDYLYKQKQRDLIYRLARIQALDQANKKYSKYLKTK